MNVWSTIALFWNGLPPGLRKFLGAGAALGLAMAVLLVTWLAWGQGLIQDRLGLVATKDDLEQQTEVLAEYKTDAIDSIVNDAIASYDLEMRLYLSEERRLAFDTAYMPLLKQVKVLTDVIIEMQKAGKKTDQRVQEIPIQFDQKLMQMMEVVAPMSQEDKINEILRQNAELIEEMNLMKDELKTSGRRTTKQRF